MANYQSTTRWPAPIDNPPLSPSSSTLPSPADEDTTPWPQHTQTSIRRLSEARPQRSVKSKSIDFARDSWKAYRSWAKRTLEWYRKAPREQQLTIGGFILLAWVLIIVTILYSKAFFAWLGPVAKKWRELPGGWLIAFSFIFITAFPPVILYSTANTVAGFVYGFPLGWPIAAAACTIGSLCAFVASRTVLGRYVDRMVGNDHRFVALGQVLRKEGLLYLTAIRFCPLPFSLSNGFLATIPSITPLSFTISTLLSTPKLLVHIFIGSRIAILVERGDKMTFRDKAVNYLSMVIGGAIGLTVGWVIYRRTMARAAAIALEQRHGQQRRHSSLSRDLESAEEGVAEYQDADVAALLDPEDAAAVMSEDDLSMWGEEGGDVYDEENARSPRDDVNHGEQDAKHGRNTN